MKKLLAFVAVIVLSLSSATFAGGNHGGHRSNHEHSHSHYKPNNYRGNRYVTYDQRRHYPKRIVYINTFPPVYSSYGVPSVFGYEGTLGSSIGSALGGIIHYNKYVR